MANGYLGIFFSILFMIRGVSAQELSVPAKEDLLELSKLDFESRYVHTSSEYSLRLYSIGYKWHQPTYELGVKFLKQDGWNKFSFNLDKEVFSFSKSLNPELFLQAQLGNNNIKVQREDDPATIAVESGSDIGSELLYGVNLQWRNLNTNAEGVNMEYHHDLYCNQAIVSQSNLVELNYNDVKVSFFKKWLENYQLKFSQQNRYISDQNLKLLRDISLLYSLGVNATSFWVGVGSEELKYDKTTSAYWSPHNFLSYGPRIEALWKLPHSIQLDMSVYYNLIHDYDYDKTGQGYNLRAKLAYGDVNANHFSVTTIDIYSMQKGDVWTQKEYLFNGTWFF